MQSQHNPRSSTALPRPRSVPRRQPLALALAAAGLLAGASLVSAGPDQTPEDTPRRLADNLGFSLVDGAPAATNALAHSRVSFLGGQFIPVTNCNDSGSGSLRAAVGAAADLDTIDMRDLDCTIHLESSVTIPQRSLRLVGPGAGQLAVGCSADRVFYHAGSGQLYAKDLTIGPGELHEDYGNARGGCIRSLGDAFVSGVALIDCHAHAPTGIATGGAIHADGLVALYDSQVSLNFAFGDEAMAGGVFAEGRLLARHSTISYNRARANADNEMFPSHAGGAFAIGPSRIEYSTISANLAGQNAGLQLLNPGSNPIEITMSTISGNHADQWVGGAYLNGNAHVVGSTITDNHAGDGTAGGDALAAGLQVGFNASVVLVHSIIAGNELPEGQEPWDFGVLGSTTVNAAHNIVASWTPGTSLPAGTITAMPLLGPLRDNGGPTRTHALLPGANVAIDTGSPDLPADAFDQRGPGFPRSVASFPGGTPVRDIGAFEYDPDRIFTTGFDLKWW